MCTHIDSNWRPAIGLHHTSVGWANSYTHERATLAAAIMYPFQPDVSGLDEDTFMQSLERAHAGAPAEQEAALLSELPVSTPSISQVRIQLARVPRPLPS